MADANSVTAGLATLGAAGWVTVEDGTWGGAGIDSVRIAIAELPTAGLAAGTLLADPATGLIYGQSDGKGGLVSLGGATLVNVSYAGVAGSLVEV